MDGLPAIVGWRIGKSWLRALLRDEPS
jgi:hypothetical protein